ncbi:kinesin-like protein 6 [Rhizoctonia solani]|uniref:Kinesin-like protein 6 n=1 Tax=Rhizoctonia solani TaxID=456999 RepID=A0A8H8SRN0_9AGAM|nr:kinesin-like protein 6 [Rhizoctonia solani]QRW15926.1 kinesin-like protein 6 [Rhizoctonia solani]
MATGMNYDFLYQPSSSSIHQPHVPGSDPSLATEIMPAPPPLSAFPRVNGKGQTIARATKSARRNDICHQHASHRFAQDPTGRTASDCGDNSAGRPHQRGHLSQGRSPEDSVELQENSIARKRARLSRQPSVPTPLPTRASSRQLRNSPLTADGDSVTPEGVALSQRVVTAPITDRETSATAPASPGTLLPTRPRPGRPRGKKSHGATPPSPSSLAPTSTSLTTRDARPNPNSVLLDQHVNGMDQVRTNVEPMPKVKISLGSRRKGKGKDNVTEAGGDHETDGQHSNNAACECCSLQGGHLVFCDGCPRSFHLLCLNPPLDELKEETWYCQTCTAKRNNIKPPAHKYKLETSTKRVNVNSLFDDLMHNLTCDPPKVFALPEDIRTHFKDVSTSNSGAYIDSGDVVKERLNRHGFVEERDPYRLRDRHGALVLCCQCGTSASSSTMDDRVHSSGDFSNRGRPIISCDYCRLHWHMDCLEPPLAVLPANGRKWMCPNHSAHSMREHGFLAQNSDTQGWRKVVTITKPGQRNNGNVEVIMDSEPVQLNSQAMRVAYEEVKINGQRYRVPEETILLDFWNKVKRNRMYEVSCPGSTSDCPSATPARSAQGDLTPSSSPLTSLSSLSDHDDEGESFLNAQDSDRQRKDDIAAAELLHLFHIQARSASSANSAVDETQPTEHSANTYGSSPLSSILSDDSQDCIERAPSRSKGTSSNSRLSTLPCPARLLAAAARPVVRTSPPPPQSAQLHPLPSTRPGAFKHSRYNFCFPFEVVRGGELDGSAPNPTKAPVDNDELSP